MEQEKYEIVKFVDNGVELEVNVSPLEDTVWLTQDQLSLLFDVDISRISRHIRSIYETGELDRIRTFAENAKVQIEGDRAITRKIKMYNLDMIIAVGYRVNSKRGTLFRQWANSVLRQYLLKGYAIDSSRVLVTPENYMNLLNVVTDMKNSQLNLESRVEQLEAKYPELDEKVLWDQHLWDAVVCLEKLISRSQKTIILIDDYVDRQTLDMLSKKQRQTEVIIVTDPKGANLTQKEIDSFNSQCGKLTVRHSKRFHDRFLILDNTELYNCGASLKDAGKKVFALNRMHDPEFIEGILARI